jgi:hypothetical protein
MFEGTLGHLWVGTMIIKRYSKIKELFAGVGVEMLLTIVQAAISCWPSSHLPFMLPTGRLHQFIFSHSIFHAVF